MGISCWFMTNTNATHVCKLAEQVELMFKEHDIFLSVGQIVRLLNIATNTLKKKFLKTAASFLQHNHFC